MNLKIQDNLNRSVELLGYSGICKNQIDNIVELQTKIRNKELIISVIGQFKRGKSTLINSILRADILPVGIVPITSIVTKIQYGSGYAVISFVDGNEKNVPLNDLAQYISEQENPNNKKDVLHANLYLPYELLKDGLVIVDTPGVGSVHKHNTEAAYSFVKDSDAIIFMLSVDSPINNIEQEFLSTARKFASKFYFAINKIDIISKSELEAYIKYCRDILCRIMEVETVDIYSISAKDSIGVEKLISTIQNDMKNSLDEILISSVNIKLREILNVALSQIKLYKNALNMPLDDFEEKKIQLNEKIASVDQISKDGLFHLEQYTDELVKSIEASFKEKKGKIINEFREKLSSVYKENIGQKPNYFDKKIKSVLETNLGSSLNQLNEEGLSI